jgi:hypothetical protein
LFISHARKFFENRRAYVHKGRGLLQIAPQFVIVQPVKSKSRWQARRMEGRSHDKARRAIVRPIFFA